MAHVSNTEPKQGPPSFFKVVRYPSTPHLVLPPAFVRTYSEEIPKNPILKTETGRHSWRVTLTKMDEDYCFAHGWAEVVKDLPLCLRDIVVFRLTDPTTFQVSFFDSEGCEKDLPSNNKGGGDDEVIRTPDEDPSFQKQISLKSHRHCLGMPRSFVKAAGLDHNKIIRVKDTKGNEWIIGVMVQKIFHRTRHSLCSGWVYFRKYHDLSEGDVCVFKFSKKEGVLCLVQVVKSKSLRNEENPMGFVKVKVEDESRGECEVVVKRKRGRPPVEKPAGGRAGEAAVRRKRGRLPGEKPAGGRAGEVAVKRRGRPPGEKPAGGGAGDVAVKRRGRPPGEKPADGRAGEVAVKGRGRPPGEKPTGGRAGEAAVKRRGRPPGEKPAGGRAGEAAVKRRGRPPGDKLPGGRAGDFVKVKIEDESEGASEVAVKSKRGRPPREKPTGGNRRFVEVETGLNMDFAMRNREKPPEKSDGVKRKRGRPRKYKPEAAVVVAEMDILSRNRQVIYF